MELLYEMMGYVSYDNDSNIVVERSYQLHDMNIPVTANIVNEDAPTIEFSFYKRADEHFEEMFLNYLQTARRRGVLY